METLRARGRQQQKRHIPQERGQEHGTHFTPCQHPQRQGHLPGNHWTTGSGVHDVTKFPALGAESWTTGTLCDGGISAICRATRWPDTDAPS